MKNKIIYLIAITLTLVSVTSCDDYLDISPEGQQNSENYFNNPQDFQGVNQGQEVGTYVVEKIQQMF